LINEPIISSSGIIKRYGRHHILNGVSFEAFGSTMVGIVGENGSGKTTLLGILAGDLIPDSGKITVNGRIGYCPQQAVLNQSLTVTQHLEFFQAAYRVSDLKYAQSLVKRLAYEEYLNRPVRELSGGTQQKLNLTIALMHHPSLLLLDEPYQGFDWETYLRFWDIAEELRAQGSCLLVISHLIFDKTRFDHIYEMSGGLLHLQPKASAAASGI
jgi:ABC-2 type transport system ATP-binding protein